MSLDPGAIRIVKRHNALVSSFSHEKTRFASNTGRKSQLLICYLCI